MTFGIGPLNATPTRKPICAAISLGKPTWWSRSRAMVTRSSVSCRPQVATRVRRWPTPEARRLFGRPPLSQLRGGVTGNIRPRIRRGEAVTVGHAHLGQRRSVQDRLRGHDLIEIQEI